MGCGVTKESIEFDMMRLKLYRMEIKDQKKMMIRHLEKLTGKKVKRIKVPDYIDHDAMKVGRSQKLKNGLSLNTPTENSKEFNEQILRLNCNRCGNKNKAKDKGNINNIANCLISELSEINTVLQTAN